MTEELGDFKTITNRILTDHKQTYHEDIAIVANYLRREIHIYKGSYPQGECEVVTSEFGFSGGPPLLVLHTGDWYTGLF